MKCSTRCWYKLKRDWRGLRVVDRRKMSEIEKREEAMEEVVSWARKIYFSSGLMMVDDDQRRRFEALGHALAKLDAAANIHTR
jgi:hypothetical protein